jgi:hypothetical protein
MRCSAIIIWRAIALALLALVPMTGVAAQAQPPGIVAQASDEEEDPLPPKRRGVVTDEPEGSTEAAEEKPLPGPGASRRADPFDARDARLRSAHGPHPAAALPGRDVVVCEAGCDGPPGVVVYRPEK